MIDKKEMSEEDVKFQYITPAITQKWSREFITMGTRITDGRVNLRGDTPREKPKQADYILYTNTKARNPIAIVEAKKNKYQVSYGMQQAITYAQMLEVPFAYSSNGDAFCEHDFLTGKERQFPMEEFPTPDELLNRYRRGKNLTDSEIQIEEQPYYTGLNTFEPRYYQRNAINRTVNAIARGQQRILLVMATGTGKTYTAFQIVYRLLKSGMKKKVLYLADRNLLVDQTIQQDFAPFEKTIHKINYTREDPATITSHEIYFSLYQQLTDRDEEDDDQSEDETVSRLKSLFQEDFFDLIIVDECHRGSAKKESNWRRTLEYFSSATQIGMTATPKETKYTSNIDYFGKPIYTYSLREGIEDGFLAPFRVINIRTSIGESWRPLKGQLGVNGKEIEDRIYTNSDYDYNIIIESRINEVAREITKYLKSTDRMQKTIVFCANEDHAERMRKELINLNSDMVKNNSDYVVRITGSDDYGKSKIDYFISVSAEYPVIATTSKLLSTGADCKMTKLIVLDQMINSMTEFKQIIGRGTRLLEKKGKMHFTVMDFRNVTRLFADPDWDGPIEQDEDYGKGETTSLAELTPDTPQDSESEPREKPVVDEHGCRVEVIGRTVSIYEPNGKLLRTESIINYTRSNICGTYASLENFISQWSAEAKKETIKNLLWERGLDLAKLKIAQGMADVDDFDFICHAAFNQKPLTRRERADNVKKRDFLNKYKGVARDVLEALLEKYMNMGVYEIEKTEVLRLEPFLKFGKPSRIAESFGGREAYMLAVKELEEELYKVG